MSHSTLSGNKYGLIIKKKETLFKKTTSSAPVIRPKLKAFCDDNDDSDEEQKSSRSSARPQTNKKLMRKQTKLEIQKALEEDSSVYEYDSIYDDMKAKNAVKVGHLGGSKDKSRKPKYIGQLMKASERRNKERQRIEERKIERERQKEGGEFSDKEAFVTSAYKKRMQERAEEEEEERRQAAMEDALDVRKQKDLYGFYRHLLNRRMGEEPSSVEEQRSTSSKPVQKKEKSIDEASSRDGRESPGNNTNRTPSPQPPADADQDSDFLESSSDEEDADNISGQMRDNGRTEAAEKRPRDDNESSDSSECGESPIRKPTVPAKRDAPPIDKKAEMASKFTKRSGTETVLSARERYLQRKKNKTTPVSNT